MCPYRHSAVLKAFVQVQTLPQIPAEHHFPRKHSRLPLQQAAKAITGYLAQSHLPYLLYYKLLHLQIINIFK